jgi:hypothetical protein
MIGLGGISCRRAIKSRNAVSMLPSQISKLRLARYSGHCGRQLALRKASVRNPRRRPMSISAIVSSSPLNQLSNLHNAAQKQRAEFQQLTQALQSGSVAIAPPASPGANTSAANLASLRSAQFTQELKALGAATTGIGSTAASPNSPASLRTAHHHYHHGGGGSPALTSGFPSSSGSPAGTADASEQLQPLNLTV